ncbi:HD-domain/PDEase-like protein [Basidiobolus meristosporus CBS 931.73]|uniref:Phosphodiesterase n=1 Tax=Basidiobolus meristosporus CBS 931.73 TaxID=1314790 RepID=A0A1Y1XZY3_9FUNG|nr:HD-domain/PDEase-like protein [Basidiobolus meristosporus CBS 931.73]|eukprot:ORX91225.1 HD-domain/PDEase-like protein [Basidiobolus meristosporus CBS 931.73]
MRLSFLRRGRSPLSPPKSSFSGGPDPNTCAILLVDSLYLAGTYHLTPYGSPQPSPTVENYDSSFNSTESNFTESRKLRKRECRAAAEFIQQLLETYKQVTAVTSGNAAMSFLHDLPSGHVGHTILLIDLDHHTSNSLYADLKQSNLSEKAPGSEGDSDVLYGLELLKVVAKELELGVVSNVIPIGKLLILPLHTHYVLIVTTLIVLSRNESPQLMSSCLDLGAVDYLVKPVSIQVIKTLWLNTSRMKRQTRSPDSGDEAASRMARLSLRVGELHDVEGKLSEVLTRDKWEALCNWEFCPYDLSEDDLLRCILIVFQDSLSIKGLKNIYMSTEMLHRFILSVRISYNDLNPYHNFYHAVDVLQASYYTLRKLGLIGNNSVHSTRSSMGGKRRIQEFMRPNDVFALIVASLAHDLGHPGVNNSYMINANTPLALLYNDQAVLENFHSMSLFLLMKKHGFDFFTDQSSQEFKGSFRKLVVRAILATDMSAHFDYIRSFVEQKKRLVEQKIVDPELERIAFSSAIIKCADISNSARPYHISERWTDSLMHEFHNQVRIF